MLKQLLIITAGSIFSFCICNAQNPFIKHMYTADPSARVFNDTLYVYPSHDPDTATWFNMVDWHVFSTIDMKNWNDHGVALSLKDLKWAKKYAWAPAKGWKGIHPFRRSICVDYLYYNEDGTIRQVKPTKQGVRE